jgi:hypothetical protein
MAALMGCWLNSFSVQIPTKKAPKKRTVFISSFHTGRNPFDPEEQTVLRTEILFVFALQRSALLFDPQSICSITFAPEEQFVLNPNRTRQLRSKETNRFYFLFSY